MARRLPSFSRSKFYGLNWREPALCSGSTSFQQFHECSNISNIKLNPDGGFGLRKGRTELGVVPNNISSMYWLAGNLYIQAANEVYLDAGGAGTPVLNLSFSSTPDRAWMSNYGLYAFYVDGINENKKYDGTTWTKLGVAAPSTPPSVAVNVAAGNLNGTYQYYYTYVYKNAGLGYESESMTREIYFSAEVSPVNQQVDVGVIASTDTQVTNIRIYRISSVAAEWQLVTETTNTTQTYTDNIADSSLGASPDFAYEGEPVDLNFTPISFETLAVWKNRVWGSNGSMLYHSREGRPEKYFNDQSDFQPMNMDPERPSELIKALVPFKNGLVVFMEDRRFMIVGDEEPFQVIDYDDGIGCIASKTARVCAGMLFWLSKDGVYIWDGVDIPIHISSPIDKDFSGGSRGLVEGDALPLSKSAAIYVPSERQYWLSTQSKYSGYNQRTFIFDMNLGKATEMSPWAIYNFGFNDAVMNDDREIITANSPGVNYVKELQGNKDFGVNVTGFYETRLWEMGTLDYDKVLFYLTAAGFTNGTDPITFKTIPQNSTSLGIDSITLSTEGDIWGSDAPATADDFWGTDTPDDPTDWWSGYGYQSRHISYPQRLVDTAFQYRIELTYDAIFYNFSIQYNLKGRKRI